MADFDLAIIGGGINGTGIARDAAGRGLRVLLVEMNDLASGTSSASSKLIHGGLRYLEHGAFRLVREALTEREVLLRMAPHVIRPMRFLLPPLPGRRTPLLLRFGLLLYDWLGARKLLPALADRRSHPSSARPRRSSARSATASNIPIAWWTMPAWSCSTRSTPPSAAPSSAPARGSRAPSARDEWELVLNCRGRREVDDRARAGQRRRPLDRRGGRHRDPPAAAGAGAADQGQPHRGAPALRARLRLHLAGAATAAWCSRCPSREDFTLIGTTDENFVGDVNSPAPDAGRDPLSLRRGEPTISATRSRPTSWSGRSPACARSMTTAPASRKTSPATTCWRSTSVPHQAPLLTVYGGKITTHRKLAEAAMAQDRPFLPGAAALDRRLHAARRRFPARRLLRGGGGVDRRAGRSCPSRMRGGWCAPMARAPSASSATRRAWTISGRRFTGDLTGAEVRYLVEHEWARDRRGRAVPAQQARPRAPARRSASALERNSSPRSARKTARQTAR